MPKARNKENSGLPERWRVTNGVYYYRVPPGLEHMWDGKKEFRLGDKLQEASAVWSERLKADGGNSITTISQLLDRYQREVIPTKAPASQSSNLNQIVMIRKVFGEMALLPFKPQLIYKYVDARSIKKIDPDTGKLKGGRITAHREIELLSHAYTKAVEWGYIDRHPFKGEVRLKGEAPRSRYVEDWEIIEALQLKPMRKSGSVLMIQAYIRIKLLTGMAQGDLLRLQPDLHFKDDGIHNQRHKTLKKTGKRTVYQWDDEVVDGAAISGPLRQAVEMAMAARPKPSQFLFCTSTAAGYVNEETGKAPGWKSMWQRFMARVLEETKVTQPFTEHDMRAKVGSDAKTLDQARAMLAHTDIRTTDRIYRRKPEMVSTGKKTT